MTSRSDKKIKAIERRIKHWKLESLGYALFMFVGTELITKPLIFGQEINWNTSFYWMIVWLIAGISFGLASRKILIQKIRKLK